MCAEERKYDDLRCALGWSEQADGWVSWVYKPLSLDAYSSPIIHHLLFLLTRKPIEESHSYNVFHWVPFACRPTGLRDVSLKVMLSEIPQQELTWKVKAIVDIKRHKPDGTRLEAVFE